MSSHDTASSHPHGTQTGHHGHHHGQDLDWNAMGETIERRGEIYAPLYAQIIDAVRGTVADPRTIIDAGSGPGVVSTALATAFPEAEVIALDSAPALLERAERRARDIGAAGRLRTVLGELPEALDALDQADVIWLGQSLHHVGDQQAVLAAAARRLAPGGLLVLLEGGLPARFLPRDLGFGRPGLESRLTAAGEDWFAVMRESLPGVRRVAEDWPALLSGAGLTAPASRSFLFDLPAPVGPLAREHVAATLRRTREGVEELMDADDLATLDRLLDPDDPAGVRHRPDVFLLDVQTVHFALRK